MTNPHILKQEFIEYARTCILSRRPSNKENFVIGRSAADSYVSFVEVDKLFSYNPEKWKDINSIFDIDSSERIKEIYLELVSDSEFNRIDSQEASQYFRSNAIKQYYCFLKAREVVLGNTKPIDQSLGNTKNVDNLSCQQIFYGAPGTGKSHRINEKTEGESVIRTTFHPDSDYSTFVGAYKPTMGLLPICDELGQPMKIGSTVLHKEQIIYEFVDQAFLQAYVNAWKFYAENVETTKKQYLVIEEINRGNCAQIFGDLFQLLDRNDYGFSVYPINADKDMKKQLEKAFKDVNIGNADSINQHYKGRNVVKEVLDGDILLLPNNLYIWATMNTSDQSLFPIDSAFKRRWEWQYMPIGKGFDKNGQEIKWAIEGATQKYDWWSFLEKINTQVGEATQSEDKKLGFFFCKATEGVISAEKFVGKVIFYLWNDVFKNNGFDGPIFQDTDGTELSFGKFYKTDAKGNAIVQKDKVELFLNNLGVEVVSETDEEDKYEEYISTDGTKSYKSKDFELKVVLDDTEVVVDGDYVDVYLETLSRIGLDKVMNLNIQCYDQNILGLNVPEKHAYRTINGYYAITFKLSKHVERILREIKERLSINMQVDFRHK